MVCMHMSVLSLCGSGNGRALQHISVCFDVLLGSPVSAACCGPRSSVTTMPLQPSVWLRGRGASKSTSSSSVVLLPYLSVLPPAFPPYAYPTSPHTHNFNKLCLRLFYMRRVIDWIRSFAFGFFFANLPCQLTNR